MSVWQRPAVQLFGVFVLLGLLAWWTFRTVSLPPSLRDLFEEDGAMAAAAIFPSKEEKWMADLAKLPAPPQEHAPEVAALILRLQNLPTVPYPLANALARDAATSPGQPPPTWTEQEKASLREVQRAYLQVWEPFFQVPAPDWPKYPDSVLLFRSTLFLQELNKDMVKLLTYRPGNPHQPSLINEPQELPAFMLPLLRQCRHLGSLRLGRLTWQITETVGTAALSAECMAGLVSSVEYTLPSLEAVRTMSEPSPALSDLRAGLESDRALLLRAADYLDRLPPATPADVALFRLFQDRTDTDDILRQAGNPETAAQLSHQLRRDADQLEILRQKTFLAGPAWRQWLSENPGRGLSPLLAGGLGGFQEFEEVRLEYQVVQAALDARIAWEKEGLPAARRIPDPAQPGSFLVVEETPEGIRISSAHVPTGQAAPFSYLLPALAEP